MCKQIDRFVTDLAENGNKVNDQLKDTQFSEFDLLHAAMNYNHSWKLYGALWRRSDYGEDLSDDERSRSSAVREQELVSADSPRRIHQSTLR